MMRTLLFSLCLIPIYANAQTYLCVSDKATGFRKESNSVWTEAHFITESKYVLKWENSYWTWTQTGQKNGSMCLSKREDVLSCDTGFSYLVFNKRLMRFIFTRPGGYALEALGNDTPFVEIGKCTAL